MYDPEEFEPGYNCPDSDHILKAAQAEQSRKPLQEYMDAIVVLRESKGFSFREIADWISKEAVPTDHNMVYREYKKHQNKIIECQEKEFGPIAPDQCRDEETAED